MSPTPALAPAPTLGGILRPALRGVVRPLAGYGDGGSGGGGPVGGFQGVLDSLSVQPVGAWSINRRLSAAYSGPLIRLIRDSDNAEQDFGYDESGVLDHTDIAIWLDGSAGYVHSVYGQIAAADLVQNLTKAALYVPNAIGGAWAAAHLGHQSRQLRGNLVDGPVGNEDHCLVFVGAMIDGGLNSNKRMCGFGDFSSSTCLYKSIDSAGVLQHWGYSGGFAGNAVGIASATNGFHLWVKRHVSGLTKGRVDVAPDYLDTVTYDIDADTYAWNNDGSPMNDFGGNTKAVEGLVFACDINDNDEIILEADLTTFYAL